MALLESDYPSITPEVFEGILTDSKWRLVYSNDETARAPRGSEVSIEVKGTPMGDGSIDYVISFGGGKAGELGVRNAEILPLTKTETGGVVMRYRRVDNVQVNLFGLKVPVPFTGGGDDKDKWDGYFVFEYVDEDIFIEKDGSDFAVYRRVKK